MCWIKFSQSSAESFYHVRQTGGKQFDGDCQQDNAEKLLEDDDDAGF